MPTHTKPLQPDWDPNADPIELDGSKPVFKDIAKSADIHLDSQPIVQFSQTYPLRGVYCLFEPPTDKPELWVANHWECHYYICNRDGSHIPYQGAYFPRKGTVETVEPQKDKDGKVVREKRLAMGWTKRNTYASVKEREPSKLAGLPFNPLNLVADDEKFHRVGLKAIYKGHTGEVKESDHWFIVHGGTWKVQAPSSDRLVDRANRFYWPKWEAYDAYIHLNLKDYKARRLERLPEWPPRIRDVGTEDVYKTAELAKWKDCCPNPQDLPGASRGNP